MKVGDHSSKNLSIKVPSNFVQPCFLVSEGYIVVIRVKKFLVGVAAN